MKQQQKRDLFSEVFFYAPEYYKHVRRQCLEAENSSPQVALSENGFVAANDRGYRTARAALGLSSGACYCEFEILAPARPAFAAPASAAAAARAEPHVRVGFCTQRAEVQAPVGYDWFGFGVRDADGAAFHEARRVVASADDDGDDGAAAAAAAAVQPFVRPGDVVGLFIRLPPLSAESTTATATAPPPKPIPGSAAAGRCVPDAALLEVHPGSEIAVAVNGAAPARTVFRGLPRGTYYPAVSLYMGARARFRTGEPAAGGSGGGSNTELRYPQRPPGWEDALSAYEVGQLRLAEIAAAQRQEQEAEEQQLLRQLRQQQQDDDVVMHTEEDPTTATATAEAAQ